MRIPDTAITIPCCLACHEWMRATMLFVYPYDAIVWVCVNGCGTLIDGHGAEPPEEEDSRVISQIAQRIGR